MPHITYVRRRVVAAGRMGRRAQSSRAVRKHRLALPRQARSETGPPRRLGLAARAQCKDKREKPVRRRHCRQFGADGALDRPASMPVGTDLSGLLHPQEHLLDYSFLKLGTDAQGSVPHPIAMTEALGNPLYCRSRELALPGLSIFETEELYRQSCPSCCLRATKYPQSLTQSTLCPAFFCQAARMASLSPLLPSPHISSPSSMVKLT